jgi:hypothetical protein
MRAPRAPEAQRRRSMILTFCAALGLGVTGPVHAGSFVPPEGCEAYLTVQSRGCVVSNHYICSADPQGHKWRADYDQEGIYFRSRIDGEAQWVESHEFNPDTIQRLDAVNADPQSFSELLSSSRDSFDFGLSKDDGTATRVTGFDRLTGNTVIIDGVALQETEYDYTETDPGGTILRQARGNEYISPEWRMFFSGRSEWNGGDGVFLPLDGSPVKFIMPGENGFGSTQPIFDCDAVLSRAPLMSVPDLIPASVAP